jgi:hypothetical protein
MAHAEARAARERFQAAVKRLGIDGEATAVAGQIITGLKAMQISPNPHPTIKEKLREDLDRFENLIAQRR